MNTDIPNKTNVSSDINETAEPITNAADGNTSAVTHAASQVLVLVTKDPAHPIAAHALRYVKAYLAQQNTLSDESQNHKTHPQEPSLSVFFYADAAATANRLRWQSADQPNLTADWQQLADSYGLDLPVCVSTALARGVTDKDNASRHHLAASSHTKDGNSSDNFSESYSDSYSVNLASDFRLVGLGDLSTALHSADKVIQF